MSGIELKRCPFCGMPPEIGRLGDKYTVQCVNPECPAVVCTTPLDTEKDAAEAWNNIKVPAKAGGVMKYEQFAANARKTYGDVCEIGGALSRAKSVLAAVPDLVGKNERLEKENRELKGENARLKAEPGDWKGDAEGFESDAYMKLPVDADGEPIRIGDEMWLQSNDGGEPLKRTVVGYCASTSMDLTYFIGLPDKQGASESCVAYLWSHRQPEPADSWEKLEEDAKQRICSYFGIDQENASCEDCPYGSSQTGRLCWRTASLDMIARAKKLAGIKEAE